MWWVGVRMSSVLKIKTGWSVCAKFQLSSLSRSFLNVPGGVVQCTGGGLVLRPILVLSLSLSQAEQQIY